jgi:hypothetical protein
MSATALEPVPEQPVAAPVRRGREVRPMSSPKVSAGVVRWTACVAPGLALLVLWAVKDGGYDSTTWLAGAIGLTVLGAWSRLALGAAHRLGRYGRVALIALALYTAWSYASILWAVDKGTALIGSDRTLLYLLLFWFFARVDWSARRLELTLLVYTFGIGVFAAATLLELALGPASQLFQGGQLSAGLGYHNATAAMGTIGAAAAILLGSSQRRHLLARCGLAALAVACLELSLLAQSRGWLYTFPLIAVALLALAPERGRILLWAAIPFGCVLATLPWLLHGWAVSDGAVSGHVAAVNMQTARVALLSALAAGLLGLLLATGQRRYRLSRRGRRLARKVTHVLAVLAIAATAGAAVIAIQSGTIARGWHQFTTDAHSQRGVSHFTELGSGRYDMWRVAAHSFIRHPLGGLGQDNFAQAYLAARHTGEEPLWVHSLELRLLAQTGAVGLAAFCAFLVCALLAYRRAARDGDPTLRLALVAALVPATVWVVHGSVDWFWELPALSGAAFAFLGAAAALEPGREVFEHRAADRRAGIRRALRLVPALGALAISGVALWVMGTAYLSERALQEGRALAAVKPPAALHDLSLAASYEPLSSTPLTLGAGIELRRGHATSTLTWARAGLRRDPGDWVLWLEAGLADGKLGRLMAENAALARARALDPQEPVIALAQRRAGTRRPLTIVQAASMLAGRARRRVAP